MAMNSVLKCSPGACPSLSQFRRCPVAFRPAKATDVRVACSGLPRPDSDAYTSRRTAILLSLSSASLALTLPSVSLADEETAFTTLYGTASPPTSYGGYGGNARESAKYSFDYPSNWKPETIGKQQKGMQGMDAKVSNPRAKSQTAYVITFGRAGEDNKNFRLGDVDQTLAGFAGADYDLQDALTGATDKVTSSRDINGQLYYDYQVLGPDISYLATVTLAGGKVFAMFIKSPAKTFKSQETTLRAMLQSFKTL